MTSTPPSPSSPSILPSPWLLRDAVAAIATLAPERLAEPWDKVGAHVGEGDWPIRGVVVCVDYTQAVLDQAVAAGANLVVSYHPPIFEPLARLTDHSWKSRLMLRTARAGVAVYSPHTALDAVAGGLNDWLCDGLGAGRRRAIEPAPSDAAQADPDSLCKLVTFVPAPHVDALRQVLAEAGAGRIGDYTQCAYTLEGEGCFLGGQGTHPAVGQAGVLEKIRETRVEMLVPRRDLPAVAAALRAVHPYEEPAFDLYPLLPEPALAVPLAPAEPVEGQGRVLDLATPVTLEILAHRLAQRLGLTRVEQAIPRDWRPERLIERVAVCAGAGHSALAKARDAQAWITGEMRHHDTLDATERGLCVLLPGHTQTERPYMPAYAARLAAALPGLDVHVSQM